MEDISELLALPELELNVKQRERLSEILGARFVPASSAADLQARTQELEKQLELDKKRIMELDEKNGRLTQTLDAKEAEHAAEKLFSEYNFASDRVKKSVLADFKAQGFKCENGTVIGGKQFLEKLKDTEPEVFAREKPEIFMGSTRGNVGMDADNSASLFASSFGLKGRLGGKL